MFDKELMLRAASAGNVLVAASPITGSWLDFGSPDIGPRTYAMQVPSVSGTTPTLNVKIQVADATDVIQEFSFEADINEAGMYYLTFATKHAKRRFYAVIVGANGNYGAVQIGPVVAGEYLDF